MNNLDYLFQFATPAQYMDNFANILECKIFIDHGWAESSNGFYSHCGEVITLISVLLSEVPYPKPGNFIKTDDTTYIIESIHAQDELIALLNVKKHE